MSSIVIDTNCIKRFQEERVSEGSGVYTVMVFAVFDKGWIAIDSGGKALHEYNECCRPSAVGLNLIDWISDAMISGKIKAFDADYCDKIALSKMGVPSKDLKWPAIAKGSAADTIVTDDIDLFDPKAKSAGAKKKSSIKTNGGPVSKFLLKQHKVSVTTAANFVSQV